MGKKGTLGQQMLPKKGKVQSLGKGNDDEREGGAEGKKSRKSSVLNIRGQRALGQT